MGSLELERLVAISSEFRELHAAAPQWCFVTLMILCCTTDTVGSGKHAGSSLAR